MNRYCAPDLEPFPALDKASSDGLIAIGGDLSPQRLQCAYSLGIFPWFEQDQPIMWWSPDPRCVLYPARFKTSRSLRKSLRSAQFNVSVDQVFESVIRACAAPRNQQQGTWITPEMQYAYCQLHELGRAHSIEVWQEGELVGGLYGVALGRIFYGESMFSRVNDASKFALKYLCERLIEKDYHMIDCQMVTEHLLSLGAEVLPRAEFIAQMKQALRHEKRFGKWGIKNS